MAPWYVLWPLRKLAALPAAGAAVVSIGAVVGSFQLTRQVASLVMPVPAERERDSAALGWSSALLFSGAVVTAREIFMRPSMPPPPPGTELREADALAVRLQATRRLFMHQLLHYPYKFRLITAFVAGASGGLAYQWSMWYYSRGGVSPAATVRAAVTSQPRWAAPQRADGSSSASSSSSSSSGSDSSSSSDAGDSWSAETSSNISAASAVDPAEEAAAVAAASRGGRTSGGAGGAGGSRGGGGNSSSVHGVISEDPTPASDDSDNEGTYRARK